jgi:hypothetical protein
MAFADDNCDATAGGTQRDILIASVLKRTWEDVCVASRASAQSPAAAVAAAAAAAITATLAAREAIAPRDPV